MIDTLQLPDDICEGFKTLAELSGTGQAGDLFDPDSEILTNNLFGVDVNEESVEIAKLSLWIKTARRGKVLDSLDANLRVGDSLIEDASFAYGLSSAIFSRDVTLALDIAKRLNAGMSHINGTTLDDEAQIPFGGVKDSGYGRSGGAVGLEELTELQWITIEGVQAPQYPITE